MKFGFIITIFFVLIEVLFVKSECVTYSECLQQISDGFLESFLNFNTTETRVEDITVPGFENVNIEPDDVDSIFKTVAGLLDKLVGGFNSQFNVFHNIDNKTIFFKTVNVSDDFENFDGVDIKTENKTNKKYLGGFKNITSIEQNIDSTTKVNTNGITPQNFVRPDTKSDNTQKPELDIYELSKSIKENEIIEIDSYNDLNENSSDYSVIDYIDLYKDTTNEYVDFKPTTVSTYNINEKETTPSYNSLVSVSTNNGAYTEEFTNATDTVFPWVTAIFIKNKTSNQFNYYCDGALLSDTVIITVFALKDLNLCGPYTNMISAASCLQKQNVTSEDLLVILGKRSLKVMSDNEIIAKIKDVHIHENFTGIEQNLALLVMNVPVTLSDRVEPARLSDGGDESATTGWAISGELTLISFEEGKYDCNKELPLNTFCSRYGNDVTVCPSYGGLYVTKQSNNWFLRGIRTDEPMNNSFCVDRTVVYTDLQSYSDWIHLYVK